MEKKKNAKLFPKEIVSQLNDIEQKIAEILEKKGEVKFVQ